MKKLLIPLLAALALPSDVNANPFSNDVIEQNELGEKTIVKKSTIVIEEPFRVKDFVAKELRSSIYRYERSKEKQLDIKKKFQNEYSNCLSTSEKSFCDDIKPYQMLISSTNSNISFDEQRIKEIEDLIEKVTKLNQEQIIWITINYTPIFEDINGKKFVQKKTFVNCENKQLYSKDYDFVWEYLPSNRRDRMYDHLFSSSRRPINEKICRKYTKFK